MKSFIGPSTGSKVTSFVMPAAVIRPAFCRTAAWYQRESRPLYARTERASPTATDQIHVGVPYVAPSSRNGAMCRSSASAFLRSSSFDHVLIVCSPWNLLGRDAMAIAKQDNRPLRAAHPEGC